MLIATVPAREKTKLASNEDRSLFQKKENNIYNEVSLTLKAFVFYILNIEHSFMHTYNTQCQKYNSVYLLYACFKYLLFYFNFFRTTCVL
jgi:hypothetical protein